MDNAMNPSEPQTAPAAASPRNRWTTGPGVATLVVLAACVALMGVLGYRLMNPTAASNIQNSARINSEGRNVAVQPHPASPFTLTTYDGREIGLESLRGKVVVLNFWSSWCPPCKDEAPALERVHQRFKDGDVVLLGVNVWDKGPEAEQFLFEHGITYTNGAPTAPLAAEYGLTGIPETFIVNPEGQVVSRWVGPIGDADLSELIAAALPAADR